MDEKVIKDIENRLLEIFDNIYVRFDDVDKQYEFIILDDSEIYFQNQHLLYKLYRKYEEFEGNFIITDDVLNEYQHLKTRHHEDSGLLMQHAQ